MLPSLAHLLRGTLRHWYQLVGGTLTSFIGVFGQAQGWAIPAWAWASLTAALLFWAVLSAYHDLRVECDAAMDGLRDRVDHQRLADELTAKHRWATHELLNRVALNGSAPSREWVAAVHHWYHGVLEVMRRHGCTPQEFNHVETINQVDMDRFRYLAEISMFIIRLDRVAQVSTTHAEAARALGLTASRQR